MSSEQSFVDFVIEQIEIKGAVTFKKMFGEYAIYLNGKVVALICDNRLFVKTTEAGRNFIANVVEAPAYTGAKMSFLIEDKLDDRDWLSNLIQITYNELPEPKPKKPKLKTENKVKNEMQR